MEDILLASSTKDTNLTVLNDLQASWSNLFTACPKQNSVIPYDYLGYIVTNSLIIPHQITRVCPPFPSSQR